jgi:hypothetical protein
VNDFERQCQGKKRQRRRIPTAALRDFVADDARRFQALGVPRKCGPVGLQAQHPALAREAQVRPGIISAKEAQIMSTDTVQTKSWVQKTPGVCGGDACMRNTRITVWGLAQVAHL